jgi:hypothetical protein
MKQLRNYYFKESSKRGSEMILVRLVADWFSLQIKQWDLLGLLKCTLDIYEMHEPKSKEHWMCSSRMWSLPMWWILIYYYWEVPGKTGTWGVFYTTFSSGKTYMIFKNWLLKIQLTSLSHPTSTIFILSAPIAGHSLNMSGFTSNPSHFSLHKNT